MNNLLSLMYMEENYIDRPFVIRPYDKAELAGLYIPNCTRKVTLRKFNHWLRFNPTLWKKLQDAELNVKTRHYNYIQVGIIISYLGNP